jgi:hypothetical protein
MMDEAKLRKIKEEEREGFARNARDDNERVEALQNFHSPDLLEKIHAELDLYHKKDDPEKLFIFLMSRTAYLPNPRDRMSIAIKGDSSVGKDSIARTVLDLTPQEDCFRLTRATRSTLEDNINNVKIVHFSEVNKNRENGANSDIIETIKQLTEGGISSVKKNQADGFKTTKHSKTDQKVIIYGTTETGIDPELDTRFVTVSIRSLPAKIEIVNDNSFAQASGLLVHSIPHESWLVKGQKYLKEYDVIFPHFAAIKESSKYFDNTNARSQRDVKRIISLAKSIAWLHQYQREIIELDGNMTIIGHPDDFLNAVVLASEFFDLSYLGLDQRSAEIYNKILEFGETGVERQVLMNFFGISRNTLKNRLRAPIDLGLIDYDQDKGSQKITYKGVKQGVKWVSEGIKIRAAMVDFNILNWLKKIRNVRTLTPVDMDLIPILQGKYSSISKIEDLWVSKLLGGYYDFLKKAKINPISSNLTPSI